MNLSMCLFKVGSFLVPDLIMCEGSCQMQGFASACLTPASHKGTMLVPLLTATDPGRLVGSVHRTWFKELIAALIILVLGMSFTMVSFISCLVLG